MRFKYHYVVYKTVYIFLTQKKKTQQSKSACREVNCQLNVENKKNIYFVCIYYIVSKKIASGSTLKLFMTGRITYYIFIHLYYVLENIIEHNMAIEAKHRTR